VARLDPEDMAQTQCDREPGDDGNERQQIVFAAFGPVIPSKNCRP
jgi:hypothetical protein